MEKSSKRTPTTTPRRRLLPVAAAALLLFSLLDTALSQPFIGVNYGEIADNLPPPSATSALLQSTTISTVRLYGVNPAIIQSLAGTNISIVIGTTNGDIPSLAADSSAAASWVAANVLSFHPASRISTISVGNEVFFSGDAGLISQLLPAMQNLRGALAAQGLDGEIRVSTVHAMAVLKQSDPPSSGVFGAPDAMKGLLDFLKETGSPFMINPYPYFAYRDDPRPETLAFCLFQPNPGRPDAGTQITYTNMFDAQVDAVRSALNAAGYPDVEIMVAETGWPYSGDAGEAGATVENAKAYNGNLVAHLRSMAGTPLMPGKPVTTYLFALYDEDLKPGPASERAFGLYRPDGTMTYDVGLAKQAAPTPQVVTPSPTPATPNPASALPVPTADDSRRPVQPIGEGSGRAPVVASDAGPSARSVLVGPSSIYQFVAATTLVLAVDFGLLSSIATFVALVWSLSVPCFL